MRATVPVAIYLTMIARHHIVPMVVLMLTRKYEMLSGFGSITNHGDNKKAPPVSRRGFFVKCRRLFHFDLRLVLE